MIAEFIMTMRKVDYVDALMFGACFLCCTVAIAFFKAILRVPR